MLQTEITVLFISSVPFLAGIVALLFTVFLYMQVKAASPGEGKQVEISQTIQRGAMAFLQTEYLWLVPFVVGMAIFFIVEEAAQVKTTDGPGEVGWKLVICFFIGAILSALSGYGGMLIATDCNVKTAEAAKGGLNPALKIAFAGGAVMGFIVVGLGITGLTVLFYLFSSGWETKDYGSNAACAVPTGVVTNITKALNALAGFSFGASAIALFARVAGGIYTKAADVGADLVGKVESGFPEDSYYNPATIADNVGDNVGDVAGMGADLFESYVGSIIAAATLALTSHCVTQNGMDVCTYDLRRVALPFWVAGFGVLASMIGFFAVRTDAAVGDENVQKALLHSLHMGIYVSGFLILVFAALSVGILYWGEAPRAGDIASMVAGTGGRCSKSGIGYNSIAADPLTGLFLDGYSDMDGWKDYGCIVIGLVTGILIGEATEFFTSYSFEPTRSITKSGITGPATVIIQGLGVGMLSAVPPVFFIAAAVMACSALSGVYGAALAAVGMLATLGITLATDAYGPVADNAGGVAEMSHSPPEIRERTDALDALGNTTAATGKGFAVGSAVLTALAFMNAYASKVKGKVLDDIAVDCNAVGVTGTACALLRSQSFDGFFSLTDPLVLSGLLIGAMLPFLFAALTMLSVGKAATGIILEVRKQLAEIPNLKKLANDSMDENWVCPAELEDVKPDVESCVTICTLASLKEMLLPGWIAVMTPIGVGLLVGAKCLGGLLMGAIATGFLLAVMMNNAGGAWDNSKKWVENEHPEIIPGEPVQKGSNHHAAVVVGDTVGDPFKDTSGPALNILIKLMSVLSLTCAGIFRDDWKTYWQGIIWVGVEIIGCIVLFYYVWWLDNTMDLLKQPRKQEEEAATPEPAIELVFKADDRNQCFAC
jgi:Na+/H+-translocating membrane pyrophosphatase